MRKFVGKLRNSMIDFYFFTQVWDNELELISLANVLQCDFHVSSDCIKTKRYPFPEQMYFARIEDRSIECNIDESIVAWFDGHASVKNFDLIRSFSSSFAVDDVSSCSFDTFAQMIWSNVFAVGCAIVKNQGKNSNLVHITCTYDKGPANSSSVYEYGEMGSKCDTGMNPKYPGLCNLNEFKANVSDTEAPPVTKWMQNGKNVETIVSDCPRSNAINESVDWRNKIVILAFNSLIVAKMLNF